MGFTVDKYKDWLFKNINLGSIMGVNIKLHWSWFLLLLIFIDYNSINDIIVSGSVLIGIFLIILMHEFGHIIMGKKYGLKIDMININMLGGAALFEDGFDDLSSLKKINIIIMGPIVNIIILLISILFFNSILGDIELNSKDLYSRINIYQKIYLILFFSNIFILIFNMLPIYPLDGGQMMREILKYFKVKNYLILSVRFTQVLSFILMLTFIIIGSINGTIIMLLIFLYSIYEVIDIKKKIIEYEVDKVFDDELKNGKDNLNHDRLIKRLEGILKEKSSGELWKRSDYGY